MSIFRGPKEGTLPDGSVIATQGDIAEALTEAIAAQSAAENAQQAAENALDTFGDQYLGAKTSDPATDNDGDALIDGALYYNTTDNVLKAYDADSDAWVSLNLSEQDQSNINTVANISTQVETVGDNISDVQDVATNLSGSDTIGTVASNINDVTAVGVNISDVVAVATNLSGPDTIGTVAGSISDVQSVSTNIGDVNTAADNITAIQDAPQFASDAEDAQGYAEEWAITAEDTPVSVDAGGDGSNDFSALHHAAKASASASSASTSEQNAAQSASDAENFRDAAAAIANAVAWDAGTTFNINDAAIGSDGNSYRSLVDNNTGNDPVTDDGSNWLQLTSAGRDFILTPENVSPADGTTGTTLTPQLEASPYRSLYGVTMVSAQWQISEVQDFATTVVDETVAGTSTTFTPSSNLDTLTNHYWRVRYTDNDGNVSDFSDATEFTTADTFIDTPTISVSGSPNDISPQPTISTSAFSVTNGSDTHVSTDWEVIETATNNVVFESANDASNLTSIDLPAGTLDTNSEYKFRARHRGSSLGASAYGEVIETTADIFTEQPTITEPADGATDIAEQPVIESSAFNTVNGSDTHVASQWVITRVSDGVEVFDSGEDTSNLESIQVPSGVLDEGEENYTVKVRHKGDTYGFSAYSPEITFTTQTEFFEYVESSIGLQTDGGYYAGNVFSDVDGYLKAVIVSDGDGDTDRTGAGDKQWRTSQTALTEAQTLADGKSVIDHIVNNETLSDFPAFEWIQTTLNNANYNGYSDWYLPARDELELIYRHFKPTTEDNDDGTRDSSGFGGDGATHGTNNSSDPTGSGYTLSDPSQTTVSSFQDGGADYLTGEYYWSSTEYDASDSWRQIFDNGGQYSFVGKDSPRLVRAVRNVTLETPYNPSNIGMEMDGGFYAGNVRSDVDGNWYALIVSDAGGDTDRTGAGTKQWRTSQTALAEAQTLSDGKSVMDHIVANETLADFPAFEWVQTTLNDANYEGYNDWYIPARDELELLYRNFKPTTEDNNDSTRSSSGFGGDGETYGTNTSSAPADYDGYTTSDPSQTSITSFQDGGADYLTDSIYWSSTEYDASDSWLHHFSYGVQTNLSKEDSNRLVRAVRRIQISQ